MLDKFETCLLLSNIHEVFSHNMIRLYNRVMPHGVLFRFYTLSQYFLMV